MQRTVAVTLVIVSALALGGWLLSAQESQKATESQQSAEVQKSESASPGVVAKVNDKAITTEELNFFLDRVLARLKARNQGQEVPLDRVAEIRKDLIDRLITQEVLFQKAQEEKIVVSEEELNQALASIQQQGTDIAPEKLKPLVMKNMIVDKLVQDNVISKVSVNDQEAEAFYKSKEDQFKHPEQIKASHILIRVEPNDSQEKKEEAKKKMAAIRDEAKAGKDFTELAKQYSEEPGAKETGGDLGYFGRGVMVPSFEEAAFGLKVGEISDIVETQFGYHIIKLTDKRDSGVTPFSEVKDDIKANLRQERIREAVKAWIDDLKAKAKIEVMDGQQ